MLNNFDALHRVANPEDHIFLTSAGVTTDSMRDRVMDAVKSRGTTNVLVLDDGHRPMHVTNDGMTKAEASMHKGKSTYMKWWTAQWLNYTFGEQADVHHIRSGNHSSVAMAEEIDGADVIVIPQGNTYLAAAGAEPYAATIRNTRAVKIGAGAGSIILGHELWPASLQPADVRPNIFPIEQKGLSIVHANIVVHTENPELDRSFDMPGIAGKVAHYILKEAQTRPDVINTHLMAHAPTMLPTVRLHDLVAAEILDGTLSFIK